MKFELKLGVIGTKPDIDWVGKNGTLLVKLNVAENHNMNKGTKDNPDWQTLRTSWYNMEAWEDVAQEMIDSGLKEGDAIRCEGYHEIKKVQQKNEKPRYYNKYKITDFEKYDKRNR